MMCRRGFSVFAIPLFLILLSSYSLAAAEETAVEIAPLMVLITGGEYEMGDTFHEGFIMEQPVHTVQVSSFYIGKYEITFDQYDAYIDAFNASLEGENPSLLEKPDDSGWGRGSRPVINVSWLDAAAYCNWLSEQEGYDPCYIIEAGNVKLVSGTNGYRLPTEAEWEFAARERGKKRRFGNGKDVADPVEINFDGNEKYKTDYSKAGGKRNQTLPVGSYAANSPGLFDMAGNVGEWCNDYYDAWFYSTPAASQKDPVGPNSGFGRVVRGGSWLSDPNYIRAANRGNARLQTNRYTYIGFRVARNAD